MERAYDDANTVVTRAALHRHSDSSLTDPS